MPSYRRPGIEQMSDRNAFRAAVIAQQSGGVFKGARTTLSMSGDRQLNATAHSLSDIMQGTLAVGDGSDMSMIINKALTNDLDFLYRSDYASISAFSTARYQDIGSLDADDPAAGPVGGGSGGPGAWQGGALTGEEVAQIGYQVGFRDENLVMMVAISKRESHWDPSAHNPNRETGDNSYGLMQINMIDELGPSRRQEYGISVNEELFDPVTNLKAAFKLSSNGTNFYHWGGYKDEDDNYNTNKSEARPVVANAEAQGLLGKTWAPKPGQGYQAGGAAGGGASSTLQNTKEELIYAGNMVANHPNNWLVRGTSAESRAFDKFLREGKKNFTFSFGGRGAPPGPAEQYSVIVFDGLTFPLPSLLNYLWLIFTHGFILDACAGALGVKYTPSMSISNHGRGGAVDISRIGIATEGRTYPVSINDTNGKRVGDALFTFLSTVNVTDQADEHGCDWKQTYGNITTYFDSGHIHLGFNRDHVGILMKALIQ
jgi:hypothetical protein